MRIDNLYPALDSNTTVAWFRQRLSLETNCADVYQAQCEGNHDFILLHTIGTIDTFQRRHIPGAIFMPHRQITAAALAHFPANTLFVAYCAGPHCNGADQAALALALLGRPVKVMPGGLSGWASEGFAFSSCNTDESTTSGT